MIAPEWRRICGIHVQDDGLIGAVWLAHDKMNDKIHLYDCCVFRQEVLAVIAEGLNARGRWIPISWTKSAQDMTDSLLERGCSILPEPVTDSQAVAEVASREIWERMRTHRFKVDKRMSEWLDEYKTFYRDGAHVPQDSHPLMSATRHAVANLTYAKRQHAKRANRKNYPKIALI